jgi:hypothetical protein
MTQPSSQTSPLDSLDASPLPPSSTPALYDLDIVRWAEATAQQLRNHEWDALDLNHLIEEIEDLSKRERDKLRSSLELVIMHLLKWVYQPQKRSRSWQVTIGRERLNIARYLRESPSLKRYLQPNWLSQTYTDARRRAAIETQLDLDHFPETSPFDLNQLLDPEFWPH